MVRNEFSSGPRAGRAIVPLALIAIAALWAVYLLRFNRGVSSPPPPLPQAAAPAPEAPSLAAEPGRSPLAEAEAARAPRLLVVDETGQPVAGARVVQWPETARSVQQASAHVVASAAADGMLDLREEAAAGSRLAVCADDFASAWVADAEKVSDDQRRLTLRRGPQFVILCTDIAGQPIAGVDVVVSRAAGQRPDAAAPAAAVLASPDASQAIHRTRSGADGRAVFTGLSAGEYGYWADLPGYVPIRGYESGGTTQVPGPTQAIQFARAVAAVVQPPDALVGSAITPRTTVGQMTAARSRAMDRERARLQARFPGALVFVGSEGDSEHAWDDLECQLVVAHRGLYVAKVPLRFTTEIDAATPLAADALVEPMQFGRVTCAMVDIGGHPYRPVQAWLATGNGLGNWRRPVGGAIEMGVSTLLPVGTYRLTSLDPVERSLLRSSPTFEVVAGAEVQHVVELKVPLRRCRVRGELPDRQPFDLFLLDTQCPELPGLSNSRALGGDREGRLVALPCARVEFEAVALGYAKVHQVVQVEPGDDDLQVTLAFGGGS